MAPAKLRGMGLTQRMAAAGHEAVDAGDITVPFQENGAKYSDHPKMKYVGPICNMCKDLAGKVSSVLGSGGFPLIIGGDHSAGIGTLAGVRRMYGPGTAVLWIDSHSDIHGFDTSPSGNVHGVPLGAAIGLDCGVLGDIFGNELIRPENIFIIGLRSYESAESETMERLGVNRYTVGDVRRRGVGSIFKDIALRLKENGATALHLSFDIDSLDPSIAPGTGIREPGGLTETEASDIITAAFATELVRSMDISELNPSRDTDNITSLLALRITDKIPPTSY